VPAITCLLLIIMLLTPGVSGRIGGVAIG